MDPVSLIIAALVAGASAGVSDAAKDGVVSLYGRLKGALLGRAEPADPGAGKVLERHAGDPDGYKIPVRDLIVESQADQDAIILELAEQVLAAADPEGARAGKYVVTMQATASGHGRVYMAGRDQHITES